MKGVHIAEFLMWVMICIARYVLMTLGLSIIVSVALNVAVDGRMSMGIFFGVIILDLGARIGGLGVKLMKERD